MPRQRLARVRAFWPGGNERRRRLVAVVLVFAVWALGSGLLVAHGVSSKDARYLLTLTGPAPIPLMYLAPNTWSPATTTCCFWSG